MMTYIFTAIGLTILCAIVFFIGFVFGLSKPPKASKKRKKSLPDIYCFQCEIEMPAKEKNGRLYCTNCKLRHGSI